MNADCSSGQATRRRRLRPLARRAGALLSRIFSFAPFLAWLASLAALAAQLLIFQHLVVGVNPWLTLSPLDVVGDVALALLPFCLLRPSWRISVWGLVGAVTFFCCANLWYCRAFYDLMPLESLGMAGNMQDQVVDSFFEQLRWADLWLAAPPLALWGVLWLLRGKWRRGSFPTWAKAALTCASAVLYMAAYMNRVYRYQASHPGQGSYASLLARYPELSKADTYKLTQHLSRMGYAGYTLWQLHECLGGKSLGAEERERVESFWLTRSRLPRAAGSYAANRDKNLILIIVESLASDAVDMEVNGVKVAPCLSGLAHSDSTILFTRVQAQVAHGRSSDGQFIYNTGLLPLRHTAVAKRYPTADYPSLAKALGYRQACEVVGEKPTFYNHSLTNLSYGYTRFSHADDEWFKDDRIFANAVKEIASLTPPFFCTVITLDMHDPYCNPVPDPSPISSASGYDSRDLVYLDKVHHFDALLGSFLQRLNAMGILDRSVVVIASDHEPRKTALGDRGLISSDLLFMAVGAGGPGVKSDRVVGQIDVMPTILDIMGVKGYKYPGLGHSLLAEPGRHGAVDAYGVAYGVDSDGLRRELDEAWAVSALMIEGGYFR